MTTDTKPSVDGRRLRTRSRRWRLAVTGSVFVWPLYFAGALSLNGVVNEVDRPVADALTLSWILITVSCAMAAMLGIVSVRGDRTWWQVSIAALPSMVFVVVFGGGLLMSLLLW